MKLSVFKATLLLTQTQLCKLGLRSGAQATARNRKRAARHRDQPLERQMGLIRD